MTIVAAHPWSISTDTPTDAVRRGLVRFKSVRTLAWTLAFFLVAEGGLRVRAYVKQGTAGPVAAIYQEDSTLGRVPKPGTVIEGAERRVTINRHGFRGAEVAQPKPAGTIRIAALGDSTTFGLEASGDDAVWVQRMVAVLNGRDDASSGSHENRPPSSPPLVRGEEMTTLIGPLLVRGEGTETPLDPPLVRGEERTHLDPALRRGESYDAINAAVPAYTLGMSAERFRRDVQPLEPDVVIVLQTATDIAAHGRRQFRRIDHGDIDEADAGLVKLMQEHSLLANLVRQNAAPWLARWAPQRRFDRLDDRGVEEYESRLRGCVEEWRSQLRQVVLCTTPRSFGDSSSSDDSYTLAATALANNPSLSLRGLNDAYDRYNDAIRRVARETDTALVDLAVEIERGSRYFIDSTHLNDAGHARVAELVAETIIKTHTIGIERAASFSSRGRPRRLKPAARHRIAPTNVISEPWRERSFQTDLSKLLRRSSH